MPNQPSFHQICRTGFALHMNRTGGTEDDIAHAIHDRFGVDLTGDDIRAMHETGYSTHLLDMVASTIGPSTVDLIYQTLQTVVPGPHGCCPTCTCGTTEAERKQLSREYLTNGQESSAAALREMRERRKSERRQAERRQSDDGLTDEAG